MKKLLLLSALLIFACSGDDSNSSDCAEFDGSTSQSSARQKAINYDDEEYNLYISSFGQPIDEGYFVYDNGDGTYDYSYMFLFANGDERYGYEVTNYCVTYGTTDYPDCNNDTSGEMDTLEDLFFDDVCDNFPYGLPEYYTRIY